MIKRSETKYFMIYCITIVAALLFLFANKFSHIKDCKQDLQTKATLVSTTVIPGDSAPIEIKRIEKAPKPVFVLIHDTIPGIADTFAILRDYFAKYAYCDTIKVDSSFLAIIKDTISQNKIFSRQFFLQNLRQTKIINTYTTESHQARKFYAGPLFGLGHDRRIAAGLSLMYISKTERPFTYSFDAVNKMHLGTFYFKLK